MTNAMTRTVQPVIPSVINRSSASIFDVVHLLITERGVAA